jgi:hypothetical protein
MNSDTFECIICVESCYKENMIILDCNHYFCYNCISTWLQQNNLCPLCRKTQQIHYDIKNTYKKMEKTPLLNTNNENLRCCIIL